MEKTPLNQIHKDLGAKLIDFGGWEMPVQYTGILEEHEAVREQAGIFDVSHMGEISIKGENALAMVQKLVTNDVARLEIGQILYSPMCYPDGGIVDDLLVYKIADDDYFLVVNASNTDKDWKWIQDNAIEGVEMANVSEDYAQIALQGPNSQKILEELTDIDLDSMKYYWFDAGKLAGVEVLLSRTGYTGELGYEIYLAAKDGVDVWNSIMKIGKEYGIKPVGLGARDTLRLEKKYCLYGNDITKDTLRNVHFPKSAIIGGVVRGNKSFIATGDTRIKPQDKVVVFALPEAIFKIEDYFNNLRALNQRSYPTIICLL